MWALWSSFGALIATYAVSRVTLRLLRGLNGWPRLLAAHALSLAALGLAIGFGKAYFNTFAAGEAAVLVLPQLVWLLLDWQRGKAGAAVR